MAEDIKLQWEWPLEREPQEKLIISIDSIEEERSFFGLKKSPSVDGYLPDPIVVTGKVSAGAESYIGKKVSIKIPKVEIEGLVVGGLAAIGIYDSMLCICIMPVASVDENLESWSCTNSDT